MAPRRGLPIRASFADNWRIDAIDPAAFAITIDRGTAGAWRVSVTHT